MPAWTRRGVLHDRPGARSPARGPLRSVVLPTPLHSYPSVTTDLGEEIIDDLSRDHDSATQSKGWEIATADAFIRRRSRDPKYSSGLGDGHRSARCCRRCWVGGRCAHGTPRRERCDHAQATTTTIAEANRQKALQKGGNVSRPYLMAAMFPPQSRETKSANAAVEAARGCGFIRSEARGPGGQRASRKISTTCRGRRSVKCVIC